MPKNKPAKSVFNGSCFILSGFLELSEGIFILTASSGLLDLLGPESSSSSEVCISGASCSTSGSLELTLAPVSVGELQYEP